LEIGNKTLVLYFVLWGKNLSGRGNFSYLDAENRIFWLLLLFCISNPGLMRLRPDATLVVQTGYYRYNQK
jgi:hypothetical protein